MTLHSALRSAAVLRAATMLSLLGGTLLLATDEKVWAVLSTGVSLGLVLKMLATYAALVAAAVWTTADLDESRAIRAPIDRR